VIEMINWVHSAAARAGLGPPEWIVIAIILALVFVAGFERGGADSSAQAITLTRRDKWVVTTLIALIISLVALAVWR
jgi:hypothetical protein